MKRKWRVGRVVLAVLVLCLSVTTYFVWRPGPLTRIPIVLDPTGKSPAETLLGIDEARNLVWTRLKQPLRRALRPPRKKSSSTPTSTPPAAASVIVL